MVDTLARAHLGEVNRKIADLEALRRNCAGCWKTASKERSAPVWSLCAAEGTKRTRYGSIPCRARRDCGVLCVLGLVQNDRSAWWLLPEHWRSCCSPISLLALRRMLQGEPSRLWRRLYHRVAWLALARRRYTAGSLGSARSIDLPRRCHSHPFRATRGLQDRDELLILKTPVDFSGIRLSFENQDRGRAHRRPQQSWWGVPACPIPSGIRSRAGAIPFSPPGTQNEGGANINAKSLTRSLKTDPSTTHNAPRTLSQTERAPAHGVLIVENIVDAQTGEFVSQRVTSRNIEDDAIIDPLVFTTAPLPGLSRNSET